MKKRILKLIAFAALIAVMLAGITACEEEVVCPSESSAIQVENHNNDVDSVLLVRRYPKQGLSKGYRMPSSNIETAYVSLSHPKTPSTRHFILCEEE